MSIKNLIESNKDSENIVLKTLQESSGTNYDIKTAIKAFDTKTKNEFGLSKYKWSGDSAKLSINTMGIFGKTLEKISLKISMKGSTADNYTYYNFSLSWYYKSGGHNGNGIGTVFINNTDKNDVKVKLEDGRYFK